MGNEMKVFEENSKEAVAKVFLSSGEFNI